MITYVKNKIRSVQQEGEGPQLIAGDAAWFNDGNDGEGRDDVERA